MTSDYYKYSFGVLECWSNGKGNFCVHAIFAILQYSRNLLLTRAIEL